MSKSCKFYIAEFCQSELKYLNCYNTMPNMIKNENKNLFGSLKSQYRLLLSFGHSSITTTIYPNKELILKLKY